MSRRSRSTPGFVVAIPGRRASLRVDLVVLDFNGTIAVDGVLIRGVAGRLRRLASRAPVVVLTADTFGTARRALAGLPVAVHVVATGADKRRFVAARGGRRVAVIGNGTNDVAMFREAGLAIAVCGREGAAAVLVRAATVVVTNIDDAVDLLLEPKRLVATLRR